MGPNDAVLKYLSDQNRPYSANDIFMNLHKEIGKTAVQKSLDHLVEKCKIKEKVYGKQKVYAVVQDDSDSNEDMGKALSDMDTQIGQITTNLSTMEQEFRSSETQLRDLLSTSTSEEALKEQKQTQERVAKLQEKLQDLSKGAVLISPKDKERIKIEYVRHLKEWRKRKSLCMDVINSILEGYPKDKKTLLEEVGVETDEDAGVSMPTLS